MANRKEYMKEYMKEYCIKNKEKLAKYKNKWYLEKRERILERKSIYYNNNKKEIMEYHKKYCNNNPEKIREYHKKYMREYRNIHKEELNKKRNKWIKKRNKIDLKFNLNDRMKSAIRRSLKGNKSGEHWECLVGYTLNDLIKRFKKTMPKNYTWQDYSKGRLHIDHIIPISAHNFTKSNQIDFKNCWALSNLQLLPAEENLRKGAKLSRPFQLTLQI